MSGSDDTQLGDPGSKGPSRTGAQLPWFSAGLTLALGAIWWAWPEIDLEVSAHFFSAACNCFPAAQTKGFAWLRSIDQAVAWAGRLALPVLLLGALLLPAWQAMQGKPCDRRRLWRNCSFMLVLGLVTPVFLVHEVLKKEIGRPRPREISAFGGDRIFTPPWEVSQRQCAQNCSFPSGHVAFPAWLMSAWHLRGRHRRRWLVGGALGCIAVAAMRIALGAHFLSDTLASVVLVWLSAWFLSRIPWWGIPYPEGR